MRRWTAAVGVLLIPALNAAVLACPMCKDSIPGATGVGGDPSGMAGGGGLPGGFNTSVYLMLLGFLGTLGLVSWTLVQGVRSPTARGPGFPVVPPDHRANDFK